MHMFVCDIDAGVQDILPAILSNSLLVRCICKTISLEYVTLNVHQPDVDDA